MTYTKAAIFLILIAIFSRFLGLLREIIIAWQFGATSLTDAFFVAFSLPYAFYSVVGTSLSAVVIPILAEYEARQNKEETGIITSLIINTVLIAISTISIFGIIFAPYVTWILGGGFDEPTLNLATEFTIIMMPSIIFMSIAGILAGVLNHNRKFIAPALGPISMNIFIILGALVGSLWFGINGLVYATVIGSIAFMVIQILALRKVGYKHKWFVNLKEPMVKRVVSTFWPVMVVSGLGFIYTAIDYRLASSLTQGSITTLNYALKLIQLPQGIFVMAVTTAIFPALSKLAAELNYNEMKRILQKGIRMILLLTVPSTVGLIMVGEILIDIIFNHGEFSNEAIIKTSSALFFYSLGLAGFCINLPLIRGFYALKDLKTPLIVGLLSIAFKLTLSNFLVAKMDHNGLALSTSITVVFSSIILGFFLQKRLKDLCDKNIIIFVTKIFIASFVMGITIYIADTYLINHQAENILQSITKLSLLIGIGIFIYALMILTLKVDEIKNWKEKFRN